MNYDGREIFLRGNHVNLKILTENDVSNSNWYGWFNDEKTTLHIQKHYFPNTKDLQLDFFNSLKDEKNKIQLGVLPIGESEIKGIASLQNIDYINSNAGISLIIGEEEFRKLIISQESIQLLLNHAFFTLNLHKIYVYYFETLQDWGLFLKKRFGFIDEGIWYEHVYKNGKYFNIHSLGLLRRDYKNKNKG